MNATATLPSAAYDNRIYAKFSKRTIEKKKINKEEFQKEFSLISDKKALLIAITVELTEKNGCDLLVELLPGMLTLNTQIIVRGVGTAKFQKIILDLAESHPGRITILEDEDNNLRKTYASSDVSMFFTKNDDSMNEIQNALTYASLPIAPTSFAGKLKDYNPNLESGNSFLYKEGEIWSAFTALVRAHENYRFPYDWKTICKNALDAA